MANSAGRLEANPWGFYNQSDRYFLPAANMQPLRCPKCKLLMAPDFLTEGRCPSCSWQWSAKEAVAMMSEQFQVGAIGGWSRERLDILDDKSARIDSVTLSKDGSVHDFQDKARQFAAARFAAVRAAMLSNNPVNSL